MTARVSAHAIGRETPVEAELLWLYSMGIVLYWVHDTSPGCEKTYRLIDVTAPLAERLVRLARLPVLRSMTRRLLAVLDEVLG